MNPLEREEAATLVAYLRIKNIKFSHLPLETGHSLEAWKRAIRMKREGVARGLPDYMCIVNGHLLFIELKRVKGSTTSPEQKEWIAALNAVPNVQAFICKGAESAIKVIDQYITNSPAPPVNSPNIF